VTTKPIAKLVGMVSSLFADAALTKPYSMPMYLPQCYLVLRGFNGSPGSPESDEASAVADALQAAMVSSEDLEVADIVSDDSTRVPASTVEAVAKFNKSNMSALLSKSLNALQHSSASGADAARGEQVEALQARAARMWRTKYT
jgi:hypothetical protein